MSIPVANATIPPDTQVGEQLQNTPPGGIPTLQSVLRRPNAVIANDASGGVPSVIAYLGLLFTNDVSLASAPGFTFSLPQGYAPSQTAFYLAFYDPSRPSLGWQLGFEGPGSVSGNNVTFSSGPAVSFQAYVYYWFALYAVPVSVPAPTPVPSVSPTTVPTVAPSSLPTGLPSPPPFTPTPSPSPTASPTPDLQLSATQLSFNAAGLTATLTASDPGYAGAFTAGSSNTGVASVQPGPNNTFTITAVAAGSATITVRESNGSSATCSVTVTTTTIPIN